MTGTKSQRKGRDFAIGFLSGLAPLIISLFMINAGSIDIVAKGLLTILISGAVLFACAMIAFIQHRKFIGLGILSLIITVPLLICGACASPVSSNSTLLTPTQTVGPK